MPTAIEKVSVDKMERTNKSAQLVKETRELFLEDFTNNQDLYDENDVKRIRDSDWYVKRFLLARRRNVNEAYKMLRDAMRWRKEFGITLTKDNDFPLEFYKTGGLFMYEPDLNGNVVIYMRIRMHKKIPELAEPVKKFIMHIMNKVDIETDGNGAAIVFDCSGAGYSNADLEFLKFLISAGAQYFPVGLKYILVYELPWVLKGIWQTVSLALPGQLLQLVKFASKNDVTNYIAIENLPDYMGGTCRRNYRTVPRGCRSVSELALQHGYTNDDIQRILPTFKPFLEEADAALASGKYYDLPEKIQNDQDISKAQALTNGDMTSLLNISPRDVIELYYNIFTKTYSSNVILQNISTKHIAYKIQSNNPKNYCVSPNLGILPPNTSVTLVIQLLNGCQHRFNDKFLILGLEVDKVVKEASQFSKLFQNNNSSIISHKLSSSLISNDDWRNNNTQYNEENESWQSEISYLKNWCSSIEKQQRKNTIKLNSLIFAVILLFILQLKTIMEI